jgi:hypothetical protein
MTKATATDPSCSANMPTAVAVEVAARACHRSGRAGVRRRRDGSPPTPIVMDGIVPSGVATVTLQPLGLT